ncbi:uncharacterized protein LOC110433464 isoform X1 [Sorghum bicolor]|uniref:uncharacterized protein LOC110433464 isoform X1 n=1 Tax=Sorghum bicolor TaxID=4558 RepID=UPI000B425161|nr:uncharacterized protein LOC110433464 isoform X1 [Sorghum bicolor]|eukprot:XP_021311312.1 uncharacterized protein LOC110433464 isoform X1 [Sorghum bicolor]
MLAWIASMMAMAMWRRSRLDKRRHDLQEKSMASVPRSLAAMDYHSPPPSNEATARFGTDPSCEGEAQEKGRKEHSVAKQSAHDKSYCRTTYRASLGQTLDSKNTLFAGKFQQRGQVRVYHISQAAIQQARTWK